jgi:streptogramin lyase
VWVTAAKDGELYRIDPKTNRVVSTVALHDRSHILGAGEESIWIAYENDGVAQRIDRHTGQVIATIATGAVDMESDGDIAIGGGSVWIITRSSLIARIDPKTNSLAGTFQAKPGTVIGRRIRYAAGSLWISGGSIFRVEAPK